MIDSAEFPEKIQRRIEIMDQMPSIGFMTAVIHIAENGDFDMFKSPKAFIAFLGVEPSVNQSGKFTGDRNKISKRAHFWGIVYCL